MYCEGAQICHKDAEEPCHDKSEQSDDTNKKEYLSSSSFQDTTNGHNEGSSVDNVNEGSSVEKIRYLSCSEMTMKHCMDIGLFTVGDMLQFRTKQPISYEWILECLRVLYHKYEMLQLNTLFDEKKKKYYWAKLPEDQVFCTEDLGILGEGMIQNRFNQIVQAGIKHGDHIWKFFFVQVQRSESQGGGEREQENVGEHRHCYCVFFVMSHALVDGIGIANIIADFFTIVCAGLIKLEKEQCREEDCASKVSKIQVSPPYEELVPNLRFYRVVSLPLSVAFRRVLKTCLNMNKVPVCRHTLFKSPNLRPMMMDNPEAPPTVGTELIKFSAREWDAFQEFRKRHGLTVTGLALAIFGVALVKYAYAGMHWPTMTLAAHILRDPRRYFKKTEMDARALVANYVASGLVIILPFFKNRKRPDLQKTVIDTARLITQQIRGNVKNFQTFFYGELHRRLSKDTDLVQKFVDVFSSHQGTCGRFSMIQFSNIGEVSCMDPQLCGDFDAIAVEKSIALADQSKSGDCFCNVLMTLQGQLHWTISYPTHLYPPDKVASIAEEVSSIWRELIPNTNQTPLQGQELES